MFISGRPKNGEPIGVRHNVVVGKDEQVTFSVP
jgi:hypothetical protein